MSIFELHAELVKLQAEMAALLKDQERINWLENNLFNREPDDWDRKYGMCRDGDTNQWALFAPKGVQGSARAIIDAAMARDNGTSIGGDTE